MLPAGKPRETTPNKRTYAFKNTPQGELKVDVYLPEGWQPGQKHSTILMFFGSILAGVIAAVLYAQQFGESGVYLGLPIAFVGMSYALLIGPIRRPNAIYLRAFRTDRATAKLRAELSAVP